MSHAAQEIGGLMRAQLERALDSLGHEPMREASAGQFPDRLWALLEELGLRLALVAEPDGGAGLGWQDATACWQLLGRFGAPVPMAEAMAAAALLSSAGLGVPEEPVALGRRAAPFGRTAKHVLLSEAGRARLHAVAAFAPGRNQAGEPRDELEPGALLASADWPAREGADPLPLALALIRSAESVGALQRILALSVDWARTRVQFGRPIGAFQAVQQQLAAMAGEVAAAQVATALAARSVDARGLAASAFEIGAAKVVSGEAARIGAATAHQVFGAIGITQEHELHLLTRRLWSWRSEGGTERSWALAIGRQAIARGGARLWPDLSARDVTGGTP